MALLLSSLVAGSNLGAPTVSGTPSGAGLTGEVRLQSGPDNRAGIWRYNGTDWVYTPGAAIQKNTSPSGTTPDGIGQFFLNTVTFDLYIATGLTSGDWQQLIVGVGGGD